MNFYTCTVDPHKGLHFDLPNKSLKQCLHDEVWLSNYNQQCHMGPAKLKSNKKVHAISFTKIFIPIYSNSQFYMTLCALHILAPLPNYGFYAPKHFFFFSTEVVQQSSLWAIEMEASQVLEWFYLHKLGQFQVSQV